MNLVQALRLHSESRIAFVGAGGKTSSMFHLARQYSHPILLTATTHLAQGQVSLADRHFVFEKSASVLAGKLPDGVTLVTGKVAAGGRTHGLPPVAVASLHAWARAHDVPMLIEADGARQKSLKAPDMHEPVIPDLAGVVAVLAGLSALGQPLTDKIVHRPEI
ncbi:MAG: selenium cofactor biosynthesis protein YqeC, partial [Anaerolineae bacterium]|nr:selenium cofactor biosynthesis protein YqeC [Anaerolineae bacterium]